MPEISQFRVVEPVTFTSAKRKLNGNSYLCSGSRIDQRRMDLVLIQKRALPLKEAFAASFSVLAAGLKASYGGLVTAHQITIVRNVSLRLEPACREFSQPGAFDWSNKLNQSKLYTRISR